MQNFEQENLFSSFVTTRYQLSKRCRPLQYKQEHITQTQENDQEKRFLRVLTASIREMRQKTFKLAIFLGPVVNKIEMGYRNRNFFSRNGPKTLIFAIFGALSPSYA